MDSKLILDILTEVKNKKPQLEYEEKIFNILEGDVTTYLNKEFFRQLNEKAAQEIQQRSCPINVLRKIIDKLSKLYATPVVRYTSNPTDQELMDSYSVDEYFSEANTAFNAFKRAGIEIYYNENEREIEFRNIPTYLYVPYCASEIEVTDMTHLVKFFKDKFYIYSDEELICVSKDGEMLPSPTDGVNEYGVIPFAYISKSKYKIMPVSDSDLYQMSLLFPVLLSDLNFSIKYMTNPIVYGVDLDTENLERNPNVFWSFKSMEEGKTPSIGSITPTADIQGILSNIKEQMSFWLETKNIKANAIGITTGDNASSGLALMIRNIDTTEDRNQQITYFRELECDFWERLAKIHNYLADIGAIDERRKFSPEFEVTVKYADQKPLEDRSQVVARLKDELSAGLISRKMAIQELNPDYDSDQVDELLKEIDDEMFMNNDQSQDQSVENG